jgi:hypothetical protein
MSYARFLAALHPDDRERTERAIQACVESFAKSSGLPAAVRCAMASTTVRMFLTLPFLAFLAFGDVERDAGHPYRFPIREYASTRSGRFWPTSVTGYVDIGWGTDDDIFTMSWIERDGPAVLPPQRRGFGAKYLTHDRPVFVN